MRIHPRFRCDQGSSLIEVIIAILVISVLSLFFMKIFYQAEQTADMSSQRLVASNLARHTAEKWRSADFAYWENRLKTTAEKKEQFVDRIPADTGDKTVKRIETINGVDYHSLVTLHSMSAGDRLFGLQSYLIRVQVQVFWVKGLESLPDDPAAVADLIRRENSSTVETFMTEEGLRQ